MDFAFPLLENVGFLSLAATVLFVGVITFGWPLGDIREHILVGVLLGLVSLVVVKVPIQGPFGATFDTRAGPIVLAGYFGGPWGGLVAAAIGGVARYSVGGPAVIGGVLSFFIYAGVGVVAQRLLPRRGPSVESAVKFLLIGLAATICVLPTFFVLRPFQTGIEILARFWSVLLIGNVLGVVVLGQILEAMLSVVEDRDNRRINEEMSILPRRAARVGVWHADLRTGSCVLDPIVREILGWAPSRRVPTLAVLLRLVHRDDRRTLIEQLRRAYAQRDPRELAFCLHNAAGDLRYVRLQLSFIGDPPGPPEGAIGTIVDRTSEMRLDQQVSLQGSALEATLSGVVIAEASGDYPLVYANKAFCTLTGYSRDEVMGRNGRFLNEGFSDQPELAIVRKALRDRTGCDQMLRNIRKDGKQIWMRVVLSPIADAHGRVTHFVGIHRDVTAEIETREALRLEKEKLQETEERFRMAFQHLPVGNIVIDQEGRIESFNTKAEEIFGYRARDVIGRNVSLLIPDAMASIHDSHLGNALKSGDAKFIGKGREFNARRKNGQTFPIHLAVGELVIRGRRSFVGSITDLTERDRAAATLRDAVHRAALATEAAEIGIWDWNILDDAMVWDEKFIEIYGLNASDKHGSFSAFQSLIHPDDVDRVTSEVQRAVEVSTKLETQFRIIRSDNRSVREIKSNAVVERDENGVAVRVIGVDLDITERLSLESQLRRSQRMQAVGQLTGGIAHDFNNLLAILLGNTELLEDAISDNEHAREYIDAIKRAVDRGSSLTHRLLTFSRQQSLTPKSSNVGELVGSLEELLRRTLGETVVLRTAFDKDLKPVLVDAHQFENALINLALNARDAMPAGGNLHVEAFNISLDETLCDFLVDVVPGDYVKVVVSDDGTGMPPEVLERAFDPFFTTKPSGKGSGLGLSMVYGFVKQSRGDMMIESEVGEGTAITLYLPVAENEVVSDSPVTAEVVMPRGAERVLVVEDDEGLRAVSVRMFRSQGYEVSEAKTGADALAALSAGPAFDLLFTDVVLPGGIDGKAVAAEAIAHDPSLKVLFTTGYAEMAICPEDGFPEGAVHLIGKPFGREDLLIKVRQILDLDGCPAAAEAPPAAHCVETALASGRPN